MSKIFSSSLILLFLVCYSIAIFPSKSNKKNFDKIYENDSSSKLNQNIQSKLNQSKASKLYQSQQYNTSYFTQKLNHFDYQDTRTFQMRYIVRQGNYDPSKNLPIFVYCGNEGDITRFYNNSGFLTDVLSDQFNALVLFIEHRYFGKSLPFNSDSFNTTNLKYLTTEQALLDFVTFLQYFIKQPNINSSSPIITFGGSYGGMLSAWMRMKFPNIVSGSISSSAPLRYYSGITAPGAFYKQVTKNYDFTKGCVNLIRETFRRLDLYKKKLSASQARLLESSFSLCNNTINNTNDVETLKSWINTAYTYMAMINYPYPTSFLKNVPAWPCNQSCSKFSALTNQSIQNIADGDLFSAAGESVKIYYNYSAPNQQPSFTGKCFNISDNSQSTDDKYMSLGWDILACGEQVMPTSSDGVNDMFYKQDFNIKDYSQYCQQQYGLTPSLDYAPYFYGGITIDDLSSYSNIFFLNGDLDPWMPGGVTQSINSKLPAYVMKGASHHLDLRSPNAQDPIDVINGRDLTRFWISQFIYDKQQQQQQQSIQNNQVQYK